VYKIRTGDTLFDNLDRAIIQIIKDTDGAINVKEVVVENVIEMIGLEILGNRSIEAVLGYLHVFPLEIQDLRLFVGQSLLLESTVILFSQNDGLKWANNDDLLVDSELFGGLLSCVFEDWESILSPVFPSADIDPLFLGLGSLVENFRHVP
jgi:hypothetical protein